MPDRSTVPKALDPSTIRTIIIAYEIASEELKDRGQLSPSTREALARTVIELAEYGIRCPVALTETALARFPGKQSRG